MLTALTINEETPTGLIKKMIAKIKPAPIKAELLSVQGISVVNIKYTCYGKKVSWKKLGKIIGTQKSCLICSSDLKLPKDEGFKRYNPCTLNVRLAENAAIAKLMQMQKRKCNISVGLYDLTGRHSDLVRYLLPYTNNIKIITENISLYMEVASDILEEYGAPISVKKNIGQLYDCNIVIAPQKILKCLPVKDNTPVYTAFAPAVCQCGNVHYKYSIKLPKIYKQLKPQGLTDTYFACVLYEKERQYSLGSLIPIEQ